MISPGLKPSLCFGDPKRRRHLKERPQHNNNLLLDLCLCKRPLGIWSCVDLHNRPTGTDNQMFTGCMSYLNQVFISVSHFASEFRGQINNSADFQGNSSLETIYFCVCCRKMPEKLRSRCGFFGDHGFDNKITSMRVRWRFTHLYAVNHKSVLTLTGFCDVWTEMLLCCNNPTFMACLWTRCTFILCLFSSHRPYSWVMGRASSSSKECQSLKT